MQQQHNLCFFYHRQFHKEKTYQLQQQVKQQPISRPGTTIETKLGIISPIKPTKDRSIYNSFTPSTHFQTATIHPNFHTQAACKGWDPSENHPLLSRSPSRGYRGADFWLVFETQSRDLFSGHLFLLVKLLVCKKRCYIQVN